MIDRESYRPRELHMVVDLGRPEDISKLRLELGDFLETEQIDQLLFVLGTMAEEDYTNHCNEATQTLGTRLGERYGEEESFFDLAPKAKYYDARSYHHLTNIGYRGDHHSIGIIVLPKTKSESVSVVIDLTYGDVSGNENAHRALVLAYPVGDKEVLKKIEAHYGGGWKKEFIFDTGKNHFRYIEPK